MSGLEDFEDMLENIESWIIGKARRIKCAAEGAIKYFRHPNFIVRGGSWEWGDHDHVCYAAQMLDKKSFQKICPIAHEKNPWFGYEDACDYCRCAGEVNFYHTKDGKPAVHFMLYHPKTIDDVYNEARTK